MANSADPDQLVSSESQLIWIYTVCKSRVYPGAAGQGLNTVLFVNPDPVETQYALPFQTVQIQISWLLKKPNDLDLHCLS